MRAAPLTLSLAVLGLLAGCALSQDAQRAPELPVQARADPTRFVVITVRNDPEPLIATPASAAQIRTLNSTALLPLQRPRPRPVLNAQGGVRNDARLRDHHRRLPGGPYRASKLPVVSIGTTFG